jgi:hypothetical protein
VAAARQAATMPKTDEVSVKTDNPLNEDPPTDEDPEAEAGDLVEPTTPSKKDVPEEEEEPEPDAMAKLYAQLGLRHEFMSGDFDVLIENWCRRASVSTWLDVTIISAILTNTVLLALQNPANQFSDDTLDIMMYIDMFLTCLFTWEMFVRIIAMGFYNPKYKLNPLPKDVNWPEVREGKEEQRYLNDAWNKLDFVVVISSWVNVIVEATGVQLGIEVSTLRALRVLRVLRSLKFFSGIKTILSVIGQALPISLNVIAFLGFLYVVCGIIGIQMFRGHTIQRCEYGSFNLQAELAPDKFPIVFGGSTRLNNSMPSMKPITGAMALDPDVTKRTTPYGKGFEYPLGIGIWYTYCTVDEDCPLFNKRDQYNRTQVCVPSLNPGKEMHSFDTILDAWVALFINMANLYWWETAHRIEDANDGLGSIIAWGYGIFNVMFLTYVSVNMFVAVITTVFADVRSAENPGGGMTGEVEIKKVKKSKPWKAPFYFVEALGGEGGPYRQKMIKGLSQGRALTEEDIQEMNDQGVTVPDKNEDGEYAMTGLINTAFFDNFIMFWIVFNTVILALDYHNIKDCCKNSAEDSCSIHDVPLDPTCECPFNPDDMCQSTTYIDVVKYLNYLFNFVFTVELVLKTLGMGFQAYIKIPFNQLDFFIVVTSLLDMFGEMTTKKGEKNELGIFKLFRIFRLFRVLRVARFLYKNKNLKRILKTVFGSGAALGNLGLFISFSITLFAIIGMHMFGGNYHPNNERLVNDDGYSTFGSCENPTGAGEDDWEKPGDKPGDICEADNSGTLFGRVIGNGKIDVTHEGAATGFGYDVGDLITKGLIPRRNFEDFPRAFLLAFQVMTGDDWVNQMHDYMAVFSNSWSPALLFFTNFAFCNFILLSLFIAVILENFEVAEAAKMKMQLDAHKTVQEKIDESRKMPKVTWVHRLAWMCGGKGKQKGTLMGMDAEKNEDGIWESETLNIHPLTGRLLAQADPTANIVRKALEVGLPQKMMQWSAEGECKVMDDEDNLKNHGWTDGYTKEPRSEECTCPVLPNEDDLKNQLPARFKWAPPNEEIIEMTVAWSTQEVDKEIKTTETDPITKEEMEAIGGMGEDSWYTDDMALFCLAPDNGFRKGCKWLATNYFFSDIFVLSAILLGTFLLAWEGPPGSLDADLVETFDIIGNYVLYVIFLIEFLAKIVGYGFVFTPEAYLKDHWNKLDFAVILGSTVTILGGNAGPIRLLRCLRPLRIVARNEGMRIIITAVVNSLAANLGVLALSSMGGLMFGILGNALFGGKFYSCNCFYAYPLGVTPENYVFDRYGVATYQGDPSDYVQPIHPYGVHGIDADQLDKEKPFQNLDYNITSQIHPIDVDSKKTCLGPQALNYPGGAYGIDPNFPDAVSQCYWDNRPYNFDTCGYAMQSLFTASTLAGWTDIMEIGLDTRGIDMQPKPFASPIYVLYFLAYILLMAFFVTNLFIGVLIDFIGHSDGTALLTEEQQKLNDMDKFKRLHRPMVKETAPSGDGCAAWWCGRAWFYGLVESKFWDQLSNGVIIFNVVVMLCEYEGMKSDFFDTLELLNFACLIFFTVEMAFKLFGWGFVKYVTDAWSQFDATVVILSWVAIIADLGSVQAIRAMRAFRIVLVLKGAKGIRSLFQTLILSVAPALNITVLLLLLYAFYAVLGMQLWGNAPMQDIECMVPDDPTKADFCKVGTREGWNDDAGAPDAEVEDFDILSASFGGISGGRPGHMLMGANRQYTHHSSFRSFGSAMKLLFQCAAGQDWKFVMYAVGGEPGNQPTEGSWIKGPAMAFFYFFSFFFLSNYILLNLFIAVILDNFAASMREQELDISERDFEEFKYMFRSKTSDVAPELLDYNRIWELLDEVGTAGGHSEDGSEIEHPFAPPPREEWSKENEMAWKLSFNPLGSKIDGPPDSDDTTIEYRFVKEFILTLYEENQSPACVDGQPGYDNTAEKYQEGDSKVYWEALIGTQAVFKTASGEMIAPESAQYAPWEEFRQWAIDVEQGKDPAGAQEKMSMGLIREAMQTLRFRENFKYVLTEFEFHNRPFKNESSQLTYDEVLRSFVQNKMGHAALTLEEQLRRDPSRESEIHASVDDGDDEFGEAKE